MSDERRLTSPKERAENDLPTTVRAYIDAYNRRDVHGMLACLADDVIFENIRDAVVTDAAEGKDAFAKMARAAVDLFSAREQTVVTAITVAGTAVARIDYRATPAQDLPNGWRSGETVTFKGRSMFEIEGGKIRRLVDES